MRMIKRWLVTVAMVAMPVVLFAQQTIPEGFRTFDDSAPRETLPAAPMVFIAYSVAWLALAFYVFSMWRKLGRVEQDLAELRRTTRR